MKNPKIKVGDQLGKLKVTDEYFRKFNCGARQRYFKCKCECGKSIDIAYSSLLKRKNLSCGCVVVPKCIDMIGNTYNNLEVLDVFFKKSKNGRRCSYAKCRCKVCGAISYPVASAVKIGQIKNCSHTRKSSLDSGRDLIKSVSVGGTNLTAIDGRRKTNKNSSTGHTGVSYNEKKGKYRAYINFRRHQYHLGFYKNIDDAIAARKEAEINIYGGFIEWYSETYPEEWDKIKDKIKR